MAHTVFICHSSKDKAVADAACAALEAHRIPCWIAPRDILAGEEYGASIIDALDECQVVLLIFSLDANNSPQVHREIERAVSKEKILVPFRIQNVVPSRSMEYALMNTHWLDAITPPLEQRLTDLCNTITRLLARHPHMEPLWQAQQPATAAPGPALSEAVAPQPPPSAAPPLSKSFWNSRTVAAVALAIALIAGVIAFTEIRGTRTPAPVSVLPPPATVAAPATPPMQASAMAQTPPASATHTQPLHVTPATPPPQPSQPATVWLGFANDTTPQDREGELTNLVGQFQRMNVPGNDCRLTALCAQVHKVCDHAIDWQGTFQSCSECSQDTNGNPKRDGSRVALCVAK